MQGNWPIAAILQNVKALKHKLSMQSFGYYYCYICSQQYASPRTVDRTSRTWRAACACRPIRGQFGRADHASYACVSSVRDGDSRSPHFLARPARAAANPGAGPVGDSHPTVRAPCDVSRLSHERSLCSFALVMEAKEYVAISSNNPSIDHGRRR